MLVCQPTSGLVSRRVLSPAGGKPLIQAAHQTSSSTPFCQSCRINSVSKCWRQKLFKMIFIQKIKGPPITSSSPAATTKFTSEGTQSALEGTRWTRVEVMTMTIIISTHLSFLRRQRVSDAGERHPGPVGGDR